MVLSSFAGYDPTKSGGSSDKATQGIRSLRTNPLSNPFFLRPSAFEALSKGTDEVSVSREQSQPWGGGETEQARPDVKSEPGFFSPDGKSPITFARDFAIANAPDNLRDEVSKTASTFETPIRRDEPPSSETSNTIDRAVSADPTRTTRTVETGKIVREERPVYNPNRATQGISSRLTQDTDTRPTVPSGRATQGIGGSAAPTAAKATQGIGSRVSNFFNTIRDTVTPSAYEYGGNIARSAFQGGEQVNRTDFKDSDVVSLFERTDADQVPRTTGAKTRFSDTKVYENEEGVLVPHTEETLKQFPPNARGLVHDYTSPPSLGVLENIPGVTAVKEAGSAIKYGYDNPLGVRGEGYVEINQPNKFEAPTAVYKDAAYLNLKSDDPNETAGGQGFIGRAISNLTGNKSDILGTEFASTELPYSQWSQKMRADYGFPNFQDSLEATANNETSFSNNYLDQYVDKMGNVKKGVTKDKFGQATGFDVGAPETYWEGGRQFEVQPEVYNQQGELVAPEGRTEITDPWSMENLEKKGFITPSSTPSPSSDIAFNSDLDRWINKTYGGAAANWYRNNPGLPSSSNPFLPAGAYVPQASIEKRDDTLIASSGDLTGLLSEKSSTGKEESNAYQGETGWHTMTDQERSDYVKWMDQQNAESKRTAEEGFLDNYIKNPEDTDLPSLDQVESGGGYIKNVDTGEVTKIGGSKPGGINTGTTTDLNPQSSQSSQPTAREHNKKQGGSWTSGYYRNQSVENIMKDGYSQSEANQIKSHIAEGDRLQAEADAMDSQVSSAYKDYQSASDRALAITVTDQNSYGDWWAANNASEAAYNRYDSLRNQQITKNGAVISHNEGLSQYL